MDALHGAGLEPHGFDGLESCGVDEGQLAAGEVFTGCTDGDSFEEPLGRVDRRPAGRPGPGPVADGQVLGVALSEVDLPA